MENASNAPVHSRQLGRSRTYSAVDLPNRLTHWHSPRANRWELMHVASGQLRTQWLGASGVSTVSMQANDSRWIGPGVRWRVVHMDPDTCFTLQIHAGDSAPASAPQPLRAALLDDAQRVRIEDAAAFTRSLATMATGETRLLRGCFDCGDALRTVIEASGQNLFWHPLQVGAEGFTALVARSAQPIGLLDYLGRDHAVIEGTLAGALLGDADHMRWLSATLARHMGIEEELLFPAYLEAGGRAPWVHGLITEHAHLKRHLASLSSTDSRRRFLLLLDGHDEKEEQIIYPDVLARLATSAADLTRAAMLYPLPMQSAGAITGARTLSN